MLDGKSRSVCNGKWASNQDVYLKSFFYKIWGKDHPFEISPGVSLTPFEISISFYLLPVKLFNQEPLKPAGELFLAHSLRSTACCLLTVPNEAQRAAFPAGCLEQVGPVCSGEEAPLFSLVFCYCSLMGRKYPFWITEFKIIFNPCFSSPI